MRSVSDKCGDVLSSPSLIRSVTAGGMRRRKKERLVEKRRSKKRYTQKEIIKSLVIKSSVIKKVRYKHRY